MPPFYFSRSPLTMNLFPLVSPTRRTRRRGGLSVAGGRWGHGALAGKAFGSLRASRPTGPVPSAPSYSGKGAPHGGVASCPGPGVGNGRPAPGTGPRPVSGEPARAGGTTPGARCTPGNARRRRGNFLGGARPDPFCGPNRGAAVKGAPPGEVIPPTAVPPGRWNRDAGAYSTSRNPAKCCRGRRVHPPGTHSTAPATAARPAGQAAVAGRAHPHHNQLPQPERVG